MFNHRLGYAALVVLGVLLLWGLQHLFYPMGSRLSYTFVRQFGSDVLNRPVGITVAHNRVYVTDTGNDRIVIFSRQGWAPP